MKKKVLVMVSAGWPAKQVKADKLVPTRPVIVAKNTLDLYVGQYAAIGMATTPARP